MTSKRERDAASRRQKELAERNAQQRRRRRVVNAVVAGLAILVVVGIVVVSLLQGDDDNTVVAQPGDPASLEEATATDDTCPPGRDPIPEPVQSDQIPEPLDGNWTVELSTTCGTVVLELTGDAAPQAVGNFVALADSGFFDDTPCHRLTTAGIFVLQCGDPTGTGTGGPGYNFGPVENAPSDDLYPAGTLAMARQGGNGESMGSQFFLVYEDSTIPADAAGGYTVFGRVTEGLDIIRSVADGGLAADGIAPARSTGIISVTAEESA